MNVLSFVGQFKFKNRTRSIPQPSSPLAHDLAQTVADLSLAVLSIPYYIGKCQQFIVVAPPLIHSDKKELCDTVSYKNRGWCRFEMVAWALLSGGQHIIVIDG